MRLYCKLIAIVLLGAAIQSFMLKDWRESETLFMLRCYLAYALDDEALKEKLLLEARHFVIQDESFLYEGRRSNATLRAR